MLIELADPVYSLGIVLIIIPFKQDIMIHPENKYPPTKKATIFFWGKIKWHVCVQYGENDNKKQKLYIDYHYK